MSNNNLQSYPMVVIKLIIPSDTHATFMLGGIAVCKKPSPVEKQLGTLQNTVRNLHAVTIESDWNAVPLSENLTQLYHGCRSVDHNLTLLATKRIEQILTERPQRHFITEQYNLQPGVYTVSTLSTLEKLQERIPDRLCNFIHNEETASFLSHLWNTPISCCSVHDFTFYPGDVIYHLTPIRRGTPEWNITIDTIVNLNIVKAQDKYYMSSGPDRVLWKIKELREYESMERFANSRILLPEILYE